MSDNKSLSTNINANTLPTLADLYSDNLETAARLEQFTVLLNQQPKPEWVKKHPFIRDYLYLPADKVEYLLKAIFKEYKIEITGQGTAFNGVWVTVRVHYKNPITQEWLYHDGIGAAQLQTAKGTSPADLANINNGALSMAFPIAKTVAIKDACDHFGVLFGANLNRKDTISYAPDLTILPPEPLSQEYINDCITEFKENHDKHAYLAGIIANLSGDYLLETTEKCLSVVLSLADLSAIAAELIKTESTKKVFTTVRHLFTNRKIALGG